MNILVIGATGGTGREVVSQAVAAGHRVRVLTRSDAKPAAAGVEPSRGDVLNVDSLRAAVQGQDAVLSALGTPLSRKPTTLLSQGTRNLVAAMRDAGARRLIAVTGIGAGESRGHGPWYYNLVIQPFLLDEIYKDKTRQEEVIRESGLDWVIVRPALLTDKPASGQFRIATDLRHFTAGHIARGDVAAFMVRQLQSDEYVGRAVVISQ